MLLLLYANKGEKVVGKIKLAKLIFIASKEISLPGVEIETKEFIPYKEGPYPVDFNDIIDFATEQNLMEVENDRIFKITSFGKRKIEEIFGNKKEILTEIEKIKEKFNKIPDDLLLAYVYLKYPGYTGRSEIKRDILEVIKKQFASFKLVARRKKISEADVERAIEEARLATLQKLRRSPE